MNIRNLLKIICICILVTSLQGCSSKKQTKENPVASDVSNQTSELAKNKSPRLPTKFDTPQYSLPSETAQDDLDKKADEYQLKVGATIRSTAGPQPLWDVLKRLANLKGMTVSWASDVNQNTLVDVDISAEDNFFEAIDNLLRQSDYFHEVKGKAIVVKYKETKVYQLGIPFMKGGYTTSVGGNFLTKREGSNNATEGTVKIVSEKNEFNVWDNVKLNLDTILEVWSARREKETLDSNSPSGEAADAARTFQGSAQKEGSAKVDARADGKGSAKSGSVAAQAEGKGTEITRRDSQAYYTIDKSVGLISVTAPRPLIEKVDQYISNLKRELYRQVAIEAKIIEVFLEDNSKIGLDWSAVLKDFNINGTTYFGTAGFGTAETGTDGQVYPWIKAKGDADSVTRFISKVALTPVSFDVMLNALNEQGDSHVLANPKLTVLNGQPAIISVGKDIAYIKTITKDVQDSGDSPTITYTAEVDNVVQGIALGVMASIIDNHKVILHLSPITTDLIGDTIPYRTFGNEGLEVGLPQVSVREMSTMVEVENGEMLVIGGLIDNVESNSGDFAPIVGSIPIIKYLFGVEEKKMRKRELVILLTPKII